MIGRIIECDGDQIVQTLAGATAGTVCKVQYTVDCNYAVPITTNELGEGYVGIGHSDKEDVCQREMTYNPYEGVLHVECIDGLINCAEGADSIMAYGRSDYVPLDLALWRTSPVSGCYQQLSFASGRAITYVPGCATLRVCCTESCNTNTGCVQTSNIGSIDNNGIVVGSNACTVISPEGNIDFGETNCLTNANRVSTDYLRLCCSLSYVAQNHGVMHALWQGCNSEVVTDSNICRNTSSLVVSTCIYAYKPVCLQAKLHTNCTIELQGTDGNNMLIMSNSFAQSCKWCFCVPTAGENLRVYAASGCQGTTFNNDGSISSVCFCGRATAADSASYANCAATADSTYGAITAICLSDGTAVFKAEFGNEFNMHNSGAATWINYRGGANCVLIGNGDAGNAGLGTLRSGNVCTDYLEIDSSSGILANYGGQNRDTTVAGFRFYSCTNGDGYNGGAYIGKVSVAHDGWWGFAELGYFNAENGECMQGLCVDRSGCVYVKGYNQVVDDGRLDGLGICRMSISGNTLMICSR